MTDGGSPSTGRLRVEEYGVEPVPRAEQTAGWRDLFAINFTFFVNPVMYVLGALAVVDGGLPLWWAVVAMVVGQALAYSLLCVIGQPGVDYGITGQVQMRAHFGYWGSRLLTSPYRVVAATYWFAAQSLTGALGIQALYGAMTGNHVRLVPVAICLGIVHAILAVLGFDVMRWMLKVVLPVSLGFTGFLIVLFLVTDEPDYAVGRVFDSPDQTLTWTGFATYVTVMCGASLTLVANVADFCRYTPTRRDMRLGLAASAVAAAVVTTFVGGYAAVATGETNPFVAVAELVSNDLVLLVLVAAIVIQGLAANVTNVYTGGLSLVNSLPRFGRLWSTIVVAFIAVTLSAFPDLIEGAQRWITYLGNLGAPLAGAVLADYLVLKRQRLDVDGLFDPDGPYRYWNGLNIPAIVAVALGAAIYFAVPDGSIKVLVGVVAGWLVYLALASAAGRLRVPVVAEETAGAGGPDRI